MTSTNTLLKRIDTLLATIKDKQQQTEVRPRVIFRCPIDEGELPSITEHDGYIVEMFDPTKREKTA